MSTVLSVLSVSPKSSKGILRYVISVTPLPARHFNLFEDSARTLAKSFAESDLSDYRLMATEEFMRSSVGGVATAARLPGMVDI